MGFSVPLIDPSETAVDRRSNPHPSPNLLRYAYFENTTRTGDPMMSKLGSAVRRFIREEEGATLIEYALAVALISLVAGAGALVLGQGISTFFSSTSSGINSINVSAPS